MSGPGGLLSNEADGTVLWPHKPGGVSFALPGVKDGTMERVATGYGLIEGPVWDPQRGLYFSDVLNEIFGTLPQFRRRHTAAPD